MAFSINESQHINTLYRIPLCRVPLFIHCYAECHYAEFHNAEFHYMECHYAECHYVECHYAVCRGATQNAFY